MKALVTAANCFFGSWLCESLVADGIDVVRASRPQVDIRDADSVSAAVRDARPDVVYHFAAQSNVKQSVLDPITTMHTNVMGSTHLFEAVREHAPAARVISIGSSAEYGESAHGVEHLGEDLPLRAKSPYGVSKAAQGQLARVYARTHQLRTIHVRPFAIIGPRKRLDAISDFCINVVKLERGQATQFSIGNVQAVRDFVDVRDAVRALRLLAEHGHAGETYNLCHGIGTSLGDVIAILRSASKVPFTPVPDPARDRPVDDMRLVGDPSRLKSLGYAPQHTLADTLAFTLDYWRNQPL